MSAPLTMQNLLRPGPPAEVPLVVIGVAELTQADLQAFAAADMPAHVHKPLERLRARHHALAKLIATGGLTDTQVCIIAGFSTSRLSLLRNDQSFKELVEFYKDEVAAEYRTYHAQLAGVAEEATAELHRRLEEAPESIGSSLLLDIVTKTADRIGHGPSSKTTQEVNITVGLADKMRAARERAQQASLIDITPAKADE